MHHRGADLQAAGAEQEKLGSIAPGGNAAHAGDWQFRTADDAVASECGEHVERDGLHGGASVTAVATFATDVGSNFQRLEIDADDGVDGVDQRDGIGTGGYRSARGHHNIGNIRRELHDDGNFGDFHDPAGDLFAIFGNLANGAAHAAFTHAVRAAIVEFDAVRAGILNAANDVVPDFRFGFHHGGNDDGTIGPGALHFGNFAKIYFQRAVGN